MRRLLNEEVHPAFAAAVVVNEVVWLRQRAHVNKRERDMPVVWSREWFVRGKGKGGNKRCELLSDLKKSRLGVWLWTPPTLYPWKLEKQINNGHEFSERIDLSTNRSSVWHVYHTHPISDTSWWTSFIIFVDQRSYQSQILSSSVKPWKVSESLRHWLIWLFFFIRSCFLEC